MITNRDIVVCTYWTGTHSDIYIYWTVDMDIRSGIYVELLNMSSSQEVQSRIYMCGDICFEQW